MASYTGFPEFITLEYAICGLIGEGSFGDVYLVKDRYSGKPFALKVLQRDYHVQKSVSNEGQLMMQLSHPNITRLHEYFETRRKCFIVMDYMKGGSLRERLEQRGNLSESLAQLYFYQMCKAIEYLHAKNITHRDLKPDNMLLASNHRTTLLKVSDFGSSNNCSNYSYTFAGTKIYVAPEVIRGIRYGKKVDIWSLGVVLFECLSNSFPFVSETAILQGNYNFRSHNWQPISDCVKSLIKSILIVDPTRRCNITYILKTGWMDDYNLKCFVAHLQQLYS